MYSKKRKSRGTRSSYCSVPMKILLEPIDEVQLSRTLSLEGVVGDKPSINDMMSRLVVVDDDSELTEREVAELALMGFGWPYSMMYDCFGEDDYVIDDDGSVLLSNNRRLKKLAKRQYKKSQSKKRGRKSSKSYDADFCDDEVYSGLEGGYEPPSKVIKFYTDIENELSCQEFRSLREFEDFCEEHNLTVNTLDYGNLLSLDEIHCCLDPVDLEYGDKVIITDRSYGGLYWTVSEDCEKYSVNTAN